MGLAIYDSSWALAAGAIAVTILFLLALPPVAAQIVGLTHAPSDRVIDAVTHAPDGRTPPNIVAVRNDTHSVSPNADTVFVPDLWLEYPTMSSKHR